MRVLQTLCDERVTINLAVCERASALTALARSFANGDDALDVHEIGAALEQRERLASTNVGDGVAIPHARVIGVGHPRIAVAIAPDGIDFEDGDKPVHILVALLSDESDPRSHMALLTKLVRTLARPLIRARMVGARSVQDVLEALAAGEEPTAQHTRYATAQ